MRRVTRSLRQRLIMIFGGVSLLLGLVSSVVIENRATQTLTSLGQDKLEEISRSIARVMSQSLVERRREIDLISRLPTLTLEDWQTESVRTIIDAVKQGYRPYAWMGLSDINGRVIVASDGLLEGVDVSARPWFIRGKERLFTGDVHEALLLARHLQPSASPSEPLRFIDFAAPVRNSQGEIIGVIATHAHWTWIEAVIKESVSQEHTSHQIDVFLVDRAGQVLYTLSRTREVELFGTSSASGALNLTLTEDMFKEYISARAAIVGPGSEDLGWSIVVRQPREIALASVSILHQQMLWLGIGLSLLLVVLADRAAVRFSRPLQDIERTASQINAGKEDVNFSVKSSGIRELDSLSLSLAGMTHTLITRKTALQDLNQSLESQVLARTADLTEANRKLESLASTDGLTGLANRRQFDKILLEEIARARRHSHPLALILLDIDFFKHFNDRYGHQAGDDCLRAVAQALKKVGRRSSDFVARYGGEEFAIILPETPCAKALELAKAVCTTVRSLDIPHSDSPIGFVTISAGVTCLDTRDPQPAITLVSRADAALYKAKVSGRNQAFLDNSGHLDGRGKPTA